MVEYYKSTGHRDRLWFEKAKQMGFLEEDSPFVSSKSNPLYKWYLNIRTRLRRNKPSGSSGKLRSRERFLHSKFGFVVAADAASLGGEQERLDRQQISYRKKLGRPSTSTADPDAHDQPRDFPADTSNIEPIEVGEDILESLNLESATARPPMAATASSSNTALSQMVRQNRQLSKQISSLLQHHTQEQSGTGVRAAAGASFAASLMTEVHPHLQMSMQQHVLHTIFQYLRRTDEILGVPQEQPPYLYLQQSSGFFPPPLLQHQIDNPYQMPPYMQMTMPPQQMPPQQMPPQQMPPPQMPRPQMPPPQMPARTQPTYTTLQPIPAVPTSSQASSSSSGFWGQAVGPATPTTAVRATTTSTSPPSPGSNLSTPVNVSTPEPAAVISPATLDALEGMLS